MADQLTLIGADYSVYTRIARSALDLKGVAYQFEMLDIFAADGPARARQAGHSFARIPVMRHGRHTIYETLAITRYIDETFDGPPLCPVNPINRARMNQIISVVDTQAYPVLVWGLHVPHSKGNTPDPAMLEHGRLVLAELERMAQIPWLCGAEVSLADLYLAPCYDFARDSAIAPEIDENYPRLKAWRDRAATVAPAH